MQKHTWGLDLAGQYGQAGQDGAASLTAAGGIGGLLATFDAGTPGTTGDDASYIFCELAGGDAHPTRNVGQLVDLSAQSLSAGLLGRYEYEVYGNLTGPDEDQNGDWLEEAGPQAATNAYRFSTKPFDADTGMGYWGHRWYDPRTGRWVSRDPIGEMGGANLHAYALNDGVNMSDRLGLANRSVACCRYDDQTITSVTGSSTLHLHHRLERTEQCSSSATTPNACCSCRADLGIGHAFTRSIESASWGSCCSCRVQVRRLNEPSPWGPAWLFGTYGSHVQVVLKCSGGRRFVLEHAGGDFVPVINHVSPILPSQGAGWIKPGYTIIAGGAPGSAVDYCIPCSSADALVAKARSLDGYTYGLYQDCHWFVRSILLASGDVKGDVSQCPPIP